MENSSYNILIIDDDDFLSDMYSLKFSEAGHSVKVISDAIEAITNLEEGNKYDIIMLDLVMPGTDGFEFLSTVREKNLLNADTSVIVLSNQSREKDIDKAESLGAQGYIVKASSIPSEVVTTTLHIKDSPQEKIIIKH